MEDLLKGSASNKSYQALFDAWPELKHNVKLITVFSKYPELGSNRAAINKFTNLKVLTHSQIVELYNQISHQRFSKENEHRITQVSNGTNHTGGPC